MKTIKKRIRSNGTVFYYQNDELHREDGPAVIYSNGEVEYWQNDRFIK